MGDYCNLGQCLREINIDLTTARKILGEDKIIGVTASNIEEVHDAAINGADYLGIGTVFATAT
jgi:thiamine-phosphate diphosphorylase/hydroxyethylthiazole kinase